MKRDCTCARVRHEHGTERAYTADKCRCTPCRAAHAVFRAGQRSNGGERTPRPAYVEADFIEDIEWMVATGETAEGASVRVGMQWITVQRRLERAGRHDLVHALADERIGYMPLCRMAGVA